MGYLGITRRHHQGCATCNRYLYVHVCIYKFCITYYILCINIVMITTLQSKWIIRSFIKFGLACREELRWTCRGGHFPIEEGVKNKNILEPPWVQYPLFFKTPLNPHKPSTSAFSVSKMMLLRSTNLLQEKVTSSIFFLLQSYQIIQTMDMYAQF